MANHSSLFSLSGNRLIIINIIPIEEKLPLKKTPYKRDTGDSKKKSKRLPLKRAKIPVLKNTTPDSNNFCLKVFIIKV
ncbi:MAG: hypothetical protein ABJF11_17130 [Reichenbachiella sp.]|uniref:hypothetical protein n=1 Tax=Reichenbachiella sp. TaxID=2184521 RepID=UPI0032667D60